jgi:hypothetical protein
MEVLYPCCCGLDVHKKSITACVLWAQPGARSRKEKRRFETLPKIYCGWRIGCASAG